MSRSQDDSFDQVTYLLSSARMALDEPVIYASFRLLEGARRTIDGTAGSNRFLTDLRAEIDDSKLRMIDDSVGYTAWLDDVLRRVVSEAKRRNSASGGPGDQDLPT